MHKHLSSLLQTLFLTNLLLPDEERQLMHSKRHRTRKVGNFFNMKKQSCHETTSQYRYLLPFAAELEQLGHMAHPGPPANPGSRFSPLATAREPPPDADAGMVKNHLPRGRFVRHPTNPTTSFSFNFTCMYDARPAVAVN